MKRIKKYITREKSVITDNENLELLFEFKNFPVFFGCTNEDINNDLHFDMQWKIDPLSGIIQLTKLVPPEILYMEQHVDATGDTWKKYNENFSDYVVKNKVGDILEIGGGSGKIAKLILEKDIKTHLTVVEPNPIFKESKNLKIIRSFFSKNLKNQCSGVETVIFSQLFEHVYQPKEFLHEIHEFLSKDGKLIFAYPNLEYWFSNFFTNAINFEHTMLLTDFYVDYLLESTGFQIEEKLEYENHSHFYVVKKSEEKTFPKLKNRYTHYKKLFQNYIDYHETLVSNLNNKIKELNGPIFLFGGHIFSQYLLEFGLDRSKIESILDNSPLKKDKRLYGTSLIVKSPMILKGFENPVVILKAGIYNSEIKKDILENINPNTTFI